MILARLLHELLLGLAFSLGYHWRFLYGKVSFYVQSYRWRLKGWRRVKSPWTLWEKRFSATLTYRAVNFEGMADADRRYAKHGTPEQYAGKDAKSR